MEDQYYYEWDENKRIGNLAKHKLDFVDSFMILESNHLLGAGKEKDGEVREIATGLIDDVMATVVFTRRDGAYRIISLRRARRDERRKYQEVFGS